ALLRVEPRLGRVAQGERRGALGGAGQLLVLVVEPRHRLGLRLELLVVQLPGLRIGVAHDPNLALDAVLPDGALEDADAGAHDLPFRLRACSISTRSTYWLSVRPSFSANRSMSRRSSGVTRR